MLANQIGVPEDVLAREYFAVFILGHAGQRWFIGGILDAEYSLNLFTPMICASRLSLLPSPYPHAESKKLQPRSTASCCAAIDSPSSDPLQPPIPHNPCPISLTKNPVRPSQRYFICRPRKIRINLISRSQHNVNSEPGHNYGCGFRISPGRHTNCERPFTSQ